MILSNVSRGTMKKSQNILKSIIKQKLILFILKVETLKSLFPYIKIIPIIRKSHFF